MSVTVSMEMLSYRWSEILAKILQNLVIDLLIIYITFSIGKQPKR